MVIQTGIIMKESEMRNEEKEGFSFLRRVSVQATESERNTNIKPNCIRASLRPLHKHNLKQVQRNETAAKNCTVYKLKQALSS